MYNAADKSPVLIAADSITSISVITGVEEQSEIELSLYPNPTTNGVVSLAGNDLRDVSSIDVFDLQGKLVRSYSNYNQRTIQLPKETGVYLIKLEGEFGIKTLRVLRD